MEFAGAQGVLCTDCESVLATNKFVEYLGDEL